MGYFYAFYRVRIAALYLYFPGQISAAKKEMLDQED